MDIHITYIIYAQCTYRGETFKAFVSFLAHSMISFHLVVLTITKLEFHSAIKAYALHMATIMVHLCIVQSLFVPLCIRNIVHFRGL